MFESYSRYYDLLYKDKDYNAEVQHVLKLFSSHGITGKDLLEFGSGTGQHGRLLAREGYNVHGIELSQEMVDKTIHISGFTCQQGDIAQVKLGRKYNAVLSLFHVMSYQVDNSQLQRVFENASAHLSNNGLFIFDYWYSPAVYTQRPEVRVKRLSDKDYEIIRIAEPLIKTEKNRVDVFYNIYIRELKTGKIDVINETHPMRHFSLPEIHLIAASNGFECVQTEELITKETPSENTWSVCSIFRKL